MKVLVACEFSGVVRRSFSSRGHFAMSCDLLAAEDGSPQHFQEDILEVIKRSGPWDLMIAHPPCTFLCSSGLHWNGRVDGRASETEKALSFVAALMAAPIKKICIENPVGCISTRIKRASQYIQPYDFGHDASKKTGLWLTGLPPLFSTKYIQPRIVNGKKRWANQTDSGQNKLAPSDDRWAERSITYQGIADAMATQWGDLL